MTPGTAAADRAERIQSVVASFVAAAGRPAILDPGEEPLSLIAGQWNLTLWNGRLVLEAWDGRRNLVRRISRLGERKRDRLWLEVERFPKSLSQLQIADLDAPEGLDLERRSSRMAFRDRFRLLLAREFPAWRLVDLSAEPNLEASLSPAWVRAFLRLGSASMAIIAAPPEAPACEDAVAFGLIWLEYLRRREKTSALHQLLIYVPLGREKDTALRLAVLQPARLVEFRLFVYDERGRTALFDLADAGNADSTLPPCLRPSFPNVVPDLAESVPADRVELSDGSISLRIRGLEFARSTGGRLTCGFGRRKRSDARTVAAMAEEIGRVRHADSEDREHPFYLANPESWIESMIRLDPQSLDASLLTSALYGQVPVFRGGDRGVIDLLGADHMGRLTVIEIKASASIPLPFQALDYWMRVSKHLAAGDFERLGYFPGITLSKDAPRILLAAPATEFHSTTETLLSAFPPEIDVTRIGLGVNWRKELKVVFRATGAERPR